MGDGSPIVSGEFEAEKIDPQRWEQFRHATRTTYAPQFPLTFPTVYRSVEFELMEKLKVDVRDLLHIEQEYEYFGRLQIGDQPFVSTEVTEIRERKMRTALLRVCEVFTHVYLHGKLMVRGRSVLLVRAAGGK